jgi:hypothetical protein
MNILVVAAFTSALLAQFPWSSPSPSASPRPTPKPTPNPYRRLEFGTPTLGNAPSGNIAVLGGWVAVKRDGRGARACISFKNTGSITATRLLIEFPMMNREGERVAEIKLDRRGTFSPGIDIMGWNSLESWQSGSNRGYDENCESLSLGVAAFPLLQARYATYRILRVEYTDGTDWTPH